MRIDAGPHRHVARDGTLLHLDARYGSDVVELLLQALRRADLTSAEVVAVEMDESGMEFETVRIDDADEPIIERRRVP